MKTFISEIAKMMTTNPEMSSRLSKYHAMKDHEGWVVHQDILLRLQGLMAGEMFSRRFTELNEREKDVQQRAYYIVKELTEFLLNPPKYFTELPETKIKMHNQRMTQSREGNVH